MIGSMLAEMLGVGVPALGLHLFSIALAKALRYYSPTLLEEHCEERGHRERAEAVAHLDQRTERAAEALAVLSGLLLAALVGIGVARSDFRPEVELVVVSVLLIGLLGYVTAGVMGKVLAESIIDATWPATGVIRALALPLTFGLRQVERLVEWLAGPSEAHPRPASVEVEIPSETDDEEDEEPELPEAVRVMIQQVMHLTRTSVTEIMTPRPKIVSLPSSVSAEQAAATFRATGLSRIPLFGENHDDIVGILYIKDLFAAMTEAKDPDAISPRKLVRPAYGIPGTKEAFDLLEELRVQRRHLAIVLDEYGGVDGLVTLEDVLEELVGTIDDEHDVPTPADPVRQIGAERYEVDATLPVESLNERLGLRLPTDGEYLTMGGLVLHTLGRVPEPGETFHAPGVTFTVTDVEDHRIRRLVVDLQGAHSVRTAS